MAAEEHAAQHALTAGEYIGHHLKHFQTGKQSGVIDMSVFNIDSIFWSVLLGCLGLFVMWRVAKSVPAAPPPPRTWKRRKDLSGKDGLLLETDGRVPSIRR